MNANTHMDGKAGLSLYGTGLRGKPFALFTSNIKYEYNCWSRRLTIKEWFPEEKTMIDIIIRKVRLCL